MHSGVCVYRCAMSLVASLAQRIRRQASAVFR